MTLRTLRSLLREWQDAPEVTLSEYARFIADVRAIEGRCEG